MDAFRAGLPTPEENESGELFRGACQRFDEVNRRVLLEETGGGSGGASPWPPDSPLFRERCLPSP